MPFQLRQALRTSLFILALIATAVLLRWLLDPWLETHVPFATLFAATAIAVWQGGYRPALFVMLVGFLICDYLFVAPRFYSGLWNLTNLVGMVVFFGSCGVLIWFGEALRRAQSVANEQRELLRTTIASIGDAVITTDVQSCIVYLNAVAEQLTGWTQAEARGRPLEEIFQIVSEQTRQRAENPAHRALNQGTVVLADHTLLISRDGCERPIDDRAAPIRDDFGHVIGCVLVFRDATERRRSEETRGWLAALVDASEDAIVSETLEGVILSWNAGAERLFGFTAEEIVGRSIFVVIPPGLHDEQRSILARLRRGERISHYETVRVAKDGRRLVVSLAVSPILDGHGRVVGASKVARDITERKRSEQARRESEERFARFMQQLPGLAWIKDAEGRYVYANDAALKAFQVSRDTLYGATDHDIFPSETAAEFLENDRLALASASGIQAIEELMHEDGRIHYSLISKFPIAGSNGSRPLVGGMAIDITERREAEEALKNADRRKDEFLATLAHELRNPLAPICNSLEILRQAEDDRQLATQARQSIERQISHMVRLVDDLLDVSRITRGSLELRKRRLPLAGVLHKAVETCRPLMEREHQRVELNLPDEPLFVVGDSVRLTQVFSNLLNNACKYTPRERTIRIAARRDGQQVEVIVEDSGVGIPGDQLDIIFDMFTQVDKPLEQSRGGLGIGLTLVKRFVELHGGTVAAHSAGLGRGSQFVVCLPLTEPPPGPESGPPPGQESGPAQATVEARGLRILIVDDNQDNARTLAILLRRSGHVIELAHDGAQALTAAAEFHPDVMLLDLGLPIVTGYNVCRDIRKRPWGGQIKIVALTGWGGREDLRKSNEAGFDFHLVKPVDYCQLTKILCGVSPQRG
jgi:PAS domain S-box-containing protein